MKKLLDIRIEEEIGRLDGIPGVLPIEFTFFNDASQDAAVRKAYDIMQSQYVLRPEDRIGYDTAIDALKDIHENLLKNKAWSLYKPDARLLSLIMDRDLERKSFPEHITENAMIWSDRSRKA